MREGIYVYGIIKTSSPQEFGTIGIDNGKPANVVTRKFKDLAAVISYSPWMVYDTLTKEKVVKDLVTHQFVIEQVMQRFTILPVKFGTILESEDEVSQFLEQGYTLLSQQLDKMEGKIELDLVAWCEIPTILATLSRRDSQLQAMQQELAQKGEQVTTEEKARLGQCIQQALQAEKARVHALILQTLKPVTEDVRLHDQLSDKMILNAAFLLEKKNEQSFSALLDTLDQQLEKNINFRVVGPLPPYNFSTILFKKIDTESIEKAKKTLGITGELTEHTLRETYHQLAKAYHPDTSSEEDTDRFQLVHAAYRILKDFVENGPIQVEVFQWRKDTQEAQKVRS